MERLLNFCEWHARTNYHSLFFGPTLTMGTGASVGRGNLVLKIVGFVHLSWSGDARGAGTDTCIGFGPQQQWLILVSSIRKLRDSPSFFPCWRQTFKEIVLGHCLTTEIMRQKPQGPHTTRNAYFAKNSLGKSQTDGFTLKKQKPPILEDLENQISKVGIL